VQQNAINYSWNGIKPSATIHNLCHQLAQAARTPDAIVALGDEQLTYQELINVLK